MKKILIIIAMFLFVGCISSTYNISQLPIEKIKNANKPSAGNSFWSVLHYVDEFRQRTDEKYLSAQIFDGKFSNSAVKDRELNVKFLIDTNSVSFQLFEYKDKNPKKGYFSSGHIYTVKTLQNNIKSSFTITQYKGSDRFTFSPQDGITIINMLLDDDNNIQFYMTDNEYWSEYRFTLQTKGFGWKYRLMLEEYGIL